MVFNRTDHSYYINRNVSKRKLGKNYKEIKRFPIPINENNLQVDFP